MIETGEQDPEIFKITYQGKPLEVLAENRQGAAVFIIELEKGRFSAFSVAVDSNGNTYWLENGEQTPLAEEIGRLIES